MTKEEGGLIVTVTRPELVPDGDDLVLRLLKNMVTHKGKWNHTRASMLQKLCALGSTSAIQTCRWFGFDPFELVRLRR